MKNRWFSRWLPTPGEGPGPEPPAGSPGRKRETTIADDLSGPLLVLHPGGPGEKVLPLGPRFFVGRECEGIEDHQRCVIDDDSLKVSRIHFEIHVDAAQGRAVIIDRSTNGTWVNGSRIERFHALPLKAGDRISITQAIEFEFRTGSMVGGEEAGHGETVVQVVPSNLVMAVGDIVSYAGLAEATKDSSLLFSTLNSVYAELRSLMSAHGATFKDYMGDAMFGYWDLDREPGAIGYAVSFCLDSVKKVDSMAPGLPIHMPDGSPLRMGWGVHVGKVAVSAMQGAVLAVVGDAANLAFRISGLANRGGRAAVIVSGAVKDMLGEGFLVGPEETVTVKSRVGEERIAGILGRKP